MPVSCTVLPASSTPLAAQVGVSSSKIQRTGQVCINMDLDFPWKLLLKLKPEYLRLSDDTLLEKCLHGKTQNQNEALKRVSSLQKFVPLYDFNKIKRKLQGMMN